MLDKNLKEFSDLLQKYKVNMHYVIVEWVFSLFCSLIPLEVQIEFFINFFESKWLHFYKVCLCLIKSKESDFKNICDSDDIYILLRFSKSNEDNGKDKKEFWKKINYEASILGKI